MDETRRSLTKDEVDEGVDVEVFTIMQPFLPSTCLHTNKITRKRRGKESENVTCQEMHASITVSKQMRMRIYRSKRTRRRRRRRRRRKIGY